MRKPKRVAILMDLSRVYDRGIIRGIMRYIHSNCPWRLYVEEDPANKIPSFTSWSGDGLIVDLDGGRISKAIPKFTGKLVGIGCLAPDILRKLDISTVKTDDQMVAEWAADHLVERGLEHFAYCGMDQRGLDQWNEIRCDSFRRCITGLPKPVGLMACNDSQGRSVLEACRQANLNVPEDVAIIGVDNDELMCELAVPPLSSVAQATEQIGFRAAELLDTLITGHRRRPVHIAIPPACLVTRQSSDIVAIDDEVVSRAIKFIREHATELVGVSEVTRHVGVSRSTLEKHFKGMVGRTVHDEFQKRRLGIARRLLTCSNLPLQVIAEQSGFRSAHYMSAVFRRELGHPPGKLRQQRSYSARI